MKIKLLLLLKFHDLSMTLGNSSNSMTFPGLECLFQNSMTFPGFHDLYQPCLKLKGSHKYSAGTAFCLSEIPKPPQTKSLSTNVATHLLDNLLAGGESDFDGAVDDGVEEVLNGALHGGSHQRDQHGVGVQERVLRHTRGNIKLPFSNSNVRINHSQPQQTNRRGSNFPFLMY